MSPLEPAKRSSSNSSQGTRFNRLAKIAATIFGATLLLVLVDLNTIFRKIIALEVEHFAAIMVLRDLARPRADADDATARPKRTIEKLRRVPRESRQSTPQGPVGKFDRWFTSTIRGSGLALDPVSAALVVVLGALAAGGALYLWREHPAAAITHLSQKRGGAENKN